MTDATLQIIISNLSGIITSVAGMIVLFRKQKQNRADASKDAVEIKQQIAEVHGAVNGSKLQDAAVKAADVLAIAAEVASTVVAKGAKTASDKVEEDLRRKAVDDAKPDSHA
jgi:hypothetical protein